MGLFNAELRKGLRDHKPDPGFWVRWNNLKFYADANVVYIEGHEHLPFILPAEVKILESFPSGVVASDGHGNKYLINGCPDDITSWYITVIMDADVQAMIQEKNKINGF